MKKLNKLYIGTNTKMYKTIEDTKFFLNELKDLTLDFKDEKIQIFVIPSFTTLESASKITNNSHIKLGAQNMCYRSISSEYGRRTKAKPCVRTVSAFFPQMSYLQHKRKYG